MKWSVIERAVEFSSRYFRDVFASLHFTPFSLFKGFAFLLIAMLLSLERSWWTVQLVVPNRVTDGVNSGVSKNVSIRLLRWLRLRYLRSRSLEI